jgi:hypothetical protein
MTPKELQLRRLLELKYQTAEARVIKVRALCEEIAEQMLTVQARRNTQPSDPADQIYHERHIGWLDQKARELSISAAKAAVEYSAATDDLRLEFGRKAALDKALKRRDQEEARRAARQLS